MEGEDADKEYRPEPPLADPVDGRGVSDLLMDQFFGGGGGAPGLLSGADAEQASVVKNLLEAVERHQWPMSGLQAAGLIKLRLLDNGDGVMSGIADRFEAYRLLAGSYRPFIEAVTAATPVKILARRGGPGR